MRKILIAALAVFLVTAPRAAEGAPVKNPAGPDMLKADKYIDVGDNYAFFTDTAFNYVAEKEFAVEGDSFEMTSVPTRIGLAFGETAQVYGIIGGARAIQSFDIGVNKIEYTTEWDLQWGVGGSAILYQRELDLFGGSILYIGIDGNITWFDPTIDEIVANGTTFARNAAGVSNLAYDIREFQAALGVGLAFERFIPYIGLKLSDVNGKANATVSGTDFIVDRMELDKKIGFYAGFDFIITERLSFNFEGRFFDETAFSVSLRIRY